jgi:hypothetical protein
MFDVLKKQLPIKQESVEDWLSLVGRRTPPMVRSADLRTSAALLLLEQASFPPAVAAGPGRSQAALPGARELKNGGMDKANATLQQILANSGFLSRPAELLGTRGYGLPQPSESSIWKRKAACARNSCRRCPAIWTRK